MKPEQPLTPLDIARKRFSRAVNPKSWKPGYVSTETEREEISVALKAYLAERLKASIP